MITQFNFEKNDIENLICIQSFVSTDERGALIKDFSKEIFDQAGIDYDIVETFYTRNHFGTLRGMHFQRIKPQPKLLRCIYGKAYVVVADIVKESKTFKVCCSYELDGLSGKSLLVPGGCALGYLIMEEGTIMSYKSPQKFISDYDSGVCWNDASLNIDWPLDYIGGRENIILSEKDKQLPSLNEYIKEKMG